MKFGCTGRELGRAGHRGANNESVSSKMLRAQRRWIGSQARFSPPSLPYSLTSTCRRWTGYSCSVRSCRGFLTCRVMIVTADAVTSVAARRANWVRPTADRNWSALGHERQLSRRVRLAGSRRKPPFHLTRSYRQGGPMQSPCERVLVMGLSSGTCYGRPRFTTTETASSWASAAYDALAIRSRHGQNLIRDKRIGDTRRCSPLRRTGSSPRPVRAHRAVR
jgi:hypothetical protein